MTRQRGLITLGVLAVLLAGCIPPGAKPTSSKTVPDPVESVPDYGPSPRLDNDIDTVFDEKPIWEQSPVTPIAEPIKPGVYKVQPGDTLFRIGERTGAGMDVIARANQLTPPYTLEVGQILIVPEGRYHSVQAGETGIAIARAYTVNWSDIITTNGLSSPFTLKIGQRLSIPASPAVTTTTPSLDPIEARAAAFKLDIDDIITGGEPAGEVTLGGTAVATTTSAPKRPLPPSVRVADPTSFSGRLAWPLRGTIVSKFGPSGQGVVNQGIDIAATPSAPIKAAGDGVVAFVGDDVADVGGLIMIKHGNGWISTYGHIGTALVTRGQNVKIGQAIGRAGTGASPLVNFQLRQDRKPVDPLKYLAQ
jgi:murein DD-endopeptidase MepM/ murein hydrolase activator NlpD